MNNGRIDFDGTYDDLTRTEYYEKIKGSLDSAHSSEDKTESSKETNPDTPQANPIRKSFLSSWGTFIIK